MELGIPANLPEEYIQDLSTRLGIYHRFVGVGSLGDVDSMEEEFLDRFGPLPWQAQNLLYVVRLKVMAGKAGVQSITRDGDLIVLRLHDEVGGARPALQRRLGKEAAVGNAQIRLDLSGLTDGWESPLVATVATLGEFREQLVAQMEAVEAVARP